MINAAQRLNAVTIKDASLPPSAEEYSEDFAGLPELSLLDLFSGYDQMALAEICRDLTAFQTPLELLRMTTLPQGIHERSTSLRQGNEEDFDGSNLSQARKAIHR